MSTITTCAACGQPLKTGRQMTDRQAFIEDQREQRLAHFLAERGEAGAVLRDIMRGPLQHMPAWRIQDYVYSFVAKDLVRVENETAVNGRARERYFWVLDVNAN